jgi:hypothetical protein
MNLELSVEDKLTIVQQHLKNILYSEYNQQISLLESQAVTIPNQSNIDGVNLQLASIASQKLVLQNEIKSLEAAQAAELSAQAAADKTASTITK